MSEWQRREEKEKLKEKLCEREVAQKLVAVGSEEGVREWKLCRAQKTDDSGGTTSELCRCAEPVCPLTHQRVCARLLSAGSGGPCRPFSQPTLPAAQ